MLEEGLLNVLELLFAPERNHDSPYGDIDVSHDGTFALNVSAEAAVGFPHFE